MKKVKVLVITGDGVNCENETAFAFRTVKAEAIIKNINDVVLEPKMIHQYHILALPGGFSFGDEISSGQVLGLKLKYGLDHELKKFVSDKKLIIGICNGFQTLVKLGLLPNPLTERMATLTHNKQGHFIDQWVDLKIQDSVCVWTQNLKNKTIELPIRHGEGRIIFKGTAQEQEVYYQTLVQQKQIVMNYKVDVNGSFHQIAALTDPTGLILGLMPHPEANLFDYLNPDGSKKSSREADGYFIFKNAMDYCLEKGLYEN